MSGISISPCSIMIVSTRKNGMNCDAHKTRVEAAEQLIREIDAWSTWEGNDAEADLKRLRDLIKGKLLTRARLKKTA